MEDNQYIFRIRIGDVRSYVECARSLTEGGDFIGLHLDGIRAVAIDVQVASDGKKLLSLAHDGAVLLVYLSQEYEVGKL